MFELGFACGVIAFIVGQCLAEWPDFSENKNNDV